jgi:hypothetical protein
MERFAFVMLLDALVDIFGKANLGALGMRYGTNDLRRPADRSPAVVHRAWEA